MTIARRAVFFDRDGVLNKPLVVNGKPHAPASLSETEIYPEARGLLEKLRALDYLLFVVTNQPNVSKGIHSRKNIEDINRALIAALSPDGIFVCYHRDEDACMCRKPKPGLLLEASRKYKLDLSECYMVGDRWRDIEAGQNAGCTTVWIDCGYQEKTPTRHDFHAFSLSGAVEWIVGRSQHKSGTMPRRGTVQGESVQ
jgi:D-glycero-D-manno-heptose 1,7-bisphosphate phosphatase